MRLKLDSQDDATRQACTHVFKSALRQYRYNLRETHFEGKANSEHAQASPVVNISDEDWRGLVKHWSDPKYQALFANVEGCVGTFLQNCHRFFPIGQI